MKNTKTQAKPKGFFLYARKSTEAEDRQVLSIDSQLDEVKSVAERLGLPIIEILSEARSAKAPGRPIFSEMMRRIYAGQAEGILCWKLDRLARNPVDGGSLIWAIKQQGIRIVTTTQSYSQQDDNTILMYIEFGMAHKYIDDLSRVVKRGLAAKAKRGWFPNVAPLGYLNDPSQPKGFKQIIIDPERFPLIRKMWELMLTGSHSPPSILQIANEEWGFRTRLGKPLCRSGIYRLLTNPFYSGVFDYPAGSGQWHEGNHKAMVTPTEYEQVQALLGRKGRRSRPVGRIFAFTGLIRCAACKAMVTAEEKHQLICGVCKYKFAYLGRDRCPHCLIKIEKMLDGDETRRPKILRYVYYHCTKQKDVTCPQRVLRVERLEEQIVAYLESIEVPEPFQEWVLGCLRQSYEHDVAARDTVVKAQRKAYKDCLVRLDNLLRLKTSPGNVDGLLLSEDEYATQRTALIKEKRVLEEAGQSSGKDAIERLVLLEEVFDFCRRASDWFKTQDPETKRLILAVFALEDSNLTLKDKNLRINAPKPFPILETLTSKTSVPRTTFEPKPLRMIKRQKDAFASSCPIRCGSRDAIRTLKHNASATKNHSYGPKAHLIIQQLVEWLHDTPPGELRLLQTKLRALFEKVGFRAGDLMNQAA